MTATCPSCGREQAQGLLCHEDSAAVETMLAAVPELVRQLDVAISKQAKVGGAGKGGLARERAPINFGALAVRDALLVAVVTWAQDVSGGTWQPEKDQLVVVRAKTAPFIGPFHDQCGHPSCDRMRLAWVDPAEPIGTQAAQRLVSDIDRIRRHPAADELVRDLGQAVKDAYRAIDRMQERQYLGRCNWSGDGVNHCPAELWAKPKATAAKCQECGYTHDVATRRFDLLDMAADMLVTVREASSYVGSYGKLVVTESTIRSYLAKGQISYHGKIGDVGTFRLGDLLVIIADHAQRKGGRPLRSESA